MRSFLFTTLFVTKGTGQKAYACLKEVGPSKIHRLSFKPIRKAENWGLLISSQKKSKF